MAGSGFRVKTHVLLVEHDQANAKAIQDTLGRSGYWVEHASTVQRGLSFMRRRKFDVVLMELHPHEEEGLHIIHTLRQHPHLVIVVLANQSSLETRVAALYAGCDDFLTKPFAMSELEARIHAQLRIRRSGNEVFTFGALQLIPAHRTCLVNGDAVDLTDWEFDLLYKMAHQTNRVFSLLELFDLSYHEESAPSLNTLQVRIASIRKKLAAVGLHRVIVTVRGSGYAFYPPQGIAG